MLIMSQDRNLLVNMDNVSNFCIVETQVGVCIRCNIITGAGEYRVLGLYKSITECKEILKDIGVRYEQGWKYYTMRV